jgi:hypothetical protein
MKYCRSEIRKHYIGDVCTTKENAGKYTCQVFISPYDPEYHKIMKEQDGNDFVDYLIADTYDEVKKMYEEKYQKAGD